MPLTVETLTAKNGQTTLRLLLEDGRKIYLHSAYDPEREARQWAENANFGPNDVVVLFGCGAGHALGALRPRLGRANHVLALDPLGAKIPPGIDPLKNHLKDPRIQRVETFSEFRSAYDQIENACWKGLSLVRLSIYEQLFPEALKELAQWFGRQTNTLQTHRATVFAAARLWQKNLFQNLLQLPSSGTVSSAFGQFKDKPAIIVSAGPSLTKNMHLLREARNRALIIATGTAARLLALEGLPYHVVISVDPNPVNWPAHFEGISHEGAVLAYDITTTPRVVASHQGPKAAFCSLPDCRWLDRYLSAPLGLIKTGGSVANIAFDMAVQLGADPIILIGQDLSYSEGLMNAAGTYHDRLAHRIPPGWFEKSREELEELVAARPGLAYLSKKGRIAVPGIAGQPVWTDRTLFGFLCWFEEAIRDLGNEHRVVNATEGGAEIQGSLVRTLAATLDEFCPRSLSDELAGILHKLSTPARLEVGDLVDHLKRGLADTHSLNGACQRALILVDEGRDKAQGKLDREILANIDKLKSLLHFSLVPTLVRLQELPTSGSPDWAKLRRSFYEHLEETLGEDRANMETVIAAMSRRQHRASEPEGQSPSVDNRCENTDSADGVKCGFNDDFETHS